MPQNKEQRGGRRGGWLKGAALVALCLVLLLSTYHMWRGEDPIGPPTGPSGPRSWARLELGLDRGWSARGANDAAAAAVTLPDLRSPGQPRTRVTYTNRFRLPQLLPRAARARLRVEGATCRTKVSLNGKQLGQWALPGLPFELDATEALLRRGENELELVIDNRAALGLSGLIRREPPVRPGGLPSANAFSAWKRAQLRGPVTLILTGDPSIASARISPSWRRRRVRARVTLHNNSGKTGEVNLRAELFLRDRSVAARAGSHTLAPGEATVDLEVPVKSPAAWGMPPHGKSQRYTLVLTLSGLAGVLDQVSYKVGFREVWATRDGLKLNGKALFLLAHAATPDLRGEVSVDQLLWASADAGYNAWHVHFGAVQRDLFELCDELGVYLIPSLLCVGPLEPGHLIPSQRYLRGYIERWLEAFHNHPSVVVWGQEQLHWWFPPGQGPKLDRPAVDLDLRGLYGTLEALARFKALARSGETGGAPPSVGNSPPSPTGLTFIHEIHRPPSLDSVPRLLEGFPGLAGCVLNPRTNVPLGRQAFKALAARTPGLALATTARKVLPAIGVTAKRDLCLLHLRSRVAPRHLGGSLLGRGSPARLRATEEGELKFWILDGEEQQDRTVQVRKALLKRKRPVMELKL